MPAPAVILLPSGAVFNLHGFASFPNGRGVRENAVERHPLLLDDDHELIASLPRMWDDVRAFPGLAE